MDETERLEIIKTSNDLNQLASRLSLDDQIRAAAKILGYKAVPPDIETFIEDPYYLGDIYGGGKLYPFWKEKLKEIFPSPIHTAHTVIVFKGGIGTGKSTCSKIVALYNMCRLDHLKDPWSTMHLARGKKFDFNFFSASVDLAQSEFVDSIQNIMTQSPYFSGGRLSPECYSMTADGTRVNKAISKDVLFYNLSEINFVNRAGAEAKLDQAFKRWSSRFEMVKGYFGNIIIDSSSRGDDSIVDDFVNDNPYSDTFVVSTNQWIVRKHLNFYFRKGSFKVYAGDSVNRAFIVENGAKITDDMDPDRVIDVPMELYPDFKYNLISALQDKAGISTKGTDSFYPETEALKSCFQLPMYSSDIVTFDFYDKTDKIIYKLDRFIQNIPDDKVLYIRYDLGVKKDYSGVAICYFDKYVVYDYDQSVKRPSFKVPLAVAISRLPGQETPISHLYEFILDLSKRFEIGCFSCDQFASRQLLQDTEREGIPTRYISVDRTDEAYVLLKNMTNNGLIQFPKNDLLLKELSELRRVGTKIDHPADGCFTGDTRVLVVNSEGSIISIRFDELVNSYSNYKVITFDGNKYSQSNIRKTWMTKEVSELIELNFDDGSTIKCTPDHRFLTRRGYVKAIDLDQEDDIISYE